jgi:hypothetical protein
VSKLSCMMTNTLHSASTVSGKWASTNSISDEFD